MPTAAAVDVGRIQAMLDHAHEMDRSAPSLEEVHRAVCECFPRNNRVVVTLLPAREYERPKVPGLAVA